MLKCFFKTNSKSSKSISDQQSNMPNQILTLTMVILISNTSYNKVK